MSELPPSERRRAVARARGDVAVSPLACAVGALGGAAVAIGLGSPGGRLLDWARRAFAATGEPERAAREALSTATAVLVPILLGALLGALVVGMAQTRGLFAPRAVGARPLVPPPRAVAWMLAAALTLLGVGAVRALLPSLAQTRGLVGVALIARAAALATLPRVLLLFGAAGLGDWAWRRLRLERALRMTRAEAAAERRDEESDPRLAAELRRRQRP